jgi:mevalonate kinase
LQTALAQPVLDLSLPDLVGPDGKPARLVHATKDVAAAFGSLMSATAVGRARLPSDDFSDVLYELLGDTPAADRQALLPLIFLCTAILPHLFLDATGTPAQGLRLKATSCSLPVGAGLGSSAALCVATAGALLELRRLLHTADAHHPAERQLDHGAINEWAYAAETLIHGNPSGLDNTVSCFGGVLRYVREPRVTAPVPAFPAMDTLLTDTRVVGRSTRELVARVAARLARYPEATSLTLAAIDAVARQFLGGAGEMTAEEVGTLMSLNHHLLGALGVGHPALDAVCEAVAKRGCWGKLTGAGGGGCALTLLPQNLSAPARSALIEELQGMGFKCYSSALGGPGVLLHASAADLPWELQSAAPGQGRWSRAARVCVYGAFAALCAARIVQSRRR